MSSIRLRFDWQEQDGSVFGSGFRFGNCFIFVTPPEPRMLSAPSMLLVDQSRSLRVHTRLFPFERESVPLDTPRVFAMLLEDEEAVILPDLSLRFVLQAEIGSSVRVRRHDEQIRTGKIVDRERALGNFRYFVVLSDGEAFEGSPVFLDDDQLVGIVAGSGPGYVTVLGIEPAASQPEGLFSNQRYLRGPVREAYRSLLPRPQVKQQPVSWF